MAQKHDRSKDGDDFDRDEKHDQSVSTVTTNSEAYYNAFNIMMKGFAEGKRRYPNKTKDDILFDRLNIIHAPSPIRIMDFGGGIGEPLVTIFHKLADLNKKVIISVEEPHQDYMEKYKLLVENTSNTCLDIAYSGPLQNYFGKSVEDLMAIGAYPQHLQDRVLALHLLYHVVHFFDRDSDPFKILQDAVSAMYAILKPGGEVLILLCQEGFLKAIGLHCFEVLFPDWVWNYKRVHEAFQSLMLRGGIVDTLNGSYPNFTATVRHEEFDVPFILPSLADAGALISISCMYGFPNDQSPFDQRILGVCKDLISKSGTELGVSVDNQGMWYLHQKTTYITITKVANK